jgi:hypothetical protein
MATSVTNPIEFEFEYRLIQAERHLKSAFDEYEYETRTLCKLATERLNDNIGRGTEILVSKAGRLLALETKIAELTSLIECLSVLKEAHEQAIIVQGITAVTRYISKHESDNDDA